MNYRVPLSKPDITATEVAYAMQCVTSGWISSRSRWVRNFEIEFGNRMDRSAIACSSGTAALYMALKALGVGRGDEVIVPALTFAATAHAVQACGALPVVVDVRGDTWTIDWPEAVKAMTERTRCVIPVSLFGQVWDDVELPDVPIIEDAAQALSRLASPHAVMSCYSFFGNKEITTGEGGMVVGKAEYVERARLWRDHGMPRDASGYQHVALGLNFRMTGVQAAIGCAQLERIESILTVRRQLERRYANCLSGHGSWLFAHVGRTADDGLIGRLAKQGIEAKRCFPPLGMLAHLRARVHPCPVAEWLSRRVVLLPLHPRLTDDEQQEIIDIVGHPGVALTDAMLARLKRERFSLA